MNEKPIKVAMLQNFPEKVVQASVVELQGTASAEYIYICIFRLYH